MNRSEFVRVWARRWPAVFRILLTLSANGYLPRRIYRHWLSQALLPDVFPNGVRFWAGPYRLFVHPQVADICHALHHVSAGVFSQALRTGMVIVDVGANVGYYTLLAGKHLRGTGHVHAVEPAPDNLAVLKRNLMLSRLGNVTVHPYAAGRRHERRTFYLTEWGGTHGLYGSDFSRLVGQMEVSVVPLDEAIQSTVDLVKIDVEGAELEVLDGMKRILRENPSLSLFVEGTRR